MARRIERRARAKTSGSRESWYDGFDVEPWYRPIEDAAARFAAAAAGRAFEARILEPGEGFEPAA